MSEKSTEDRNGLANSKKEVIKAYVHWTPPRKYNPAKRNPPKQNTKKNPQIDTNKI